MKSRSGKDLHAEVRYWQRSLPTEMSAAIKGFHQLDARSHCVGPVIALIWGLAAYAMSLAPASLAVQLTGTFVIGVLIHATAVLMHEGGHGNLFRSPKKDRLLGFIYGIPSLMSVTAYAVTHHRHHSMTRTEDDPDDITNVSKNRKIVNVAYYAWILGGATLYFVHSPAVALKFAKPAERRKIIEEYVVMGAILAAIFCMVDFALIADYWLKPIGAGIVVGSLRGMAEHTLTEQGSAFTRSRTVISNRFVSTALLNMNYHLEHHLFPGIPWYRLPGAHRVLKPLLENEGGFYHGSLLHFIYRAIRQGAFGEVRA